MQAASHFVKRTLGGLLVDKKCVEQIRAEQKKLVEQLMAVVSGSTSPVGTTVASAGPPTRRLLAHCLATLFRDDDVRKLDHANCTINSV